MNKLDELKKFNFIWNIESINVVAKIILGIPLSQEFKNVINRLTDVNIENIKKWFFKYWLPIFSTYKVNNTDNSIYANGEKAEGFPMQVLFYLYDKEAWNQYVETVKRMRNNNDYYTSGRGIRKVNTLRITSFKYIFNYFASKDMWEDYKDLIKEISKWKMTKGETIDTLCDYYYYVSYNKKDKFKYEVLPFIKTLYKEQDIKEAYKEYKDLISIPPIARSSIQNESYKSIIKRWKEFI